MLVTSLWKRQPGKYFCIATKSPNGKWREHWFTPNDFNEVAEFVRDFKDSDVYFCPHGFKSKRRKKEFAVPPKLLWADLDEAAPHNMKPKPTVSIESSPGRYVGFWFTDKPVTDQINRQLTYTVGADKGGWDYTQVLRVPHTYNHKYPSVPKVRLLWDDGPIWKLEDIIRLLPDMKKGDDEEMQSSTLTAREVYDKYEKVIPRWARKELINGKPKVGSRSDMLWKLENALLEIGMTKDETFVLIKASPWNKFRGRNNEDEQLRRELSKAVGDRLRNPEKIEVRSGYSFLSTPISDVQEAPVDWLWYPYLARGEITILEGDPGIGKSFIAQYVAVHIVDGKRLPSTRRLPKVCGTITYFDIENDARHVTKPRLRAMGISDEGQTRFFQEEQLWSVDDEDALDEVVTALEQRKPKLIVFDTINSYMGDADTNNAKEATQALNNFKEIARRLNCAVLILRHLTKSTKEKALYRGQGSIAFAGVARIVLGVGRPDGDAPERYLVNYKNNLAKEAPPLEYILEEIPGFVDQTRVVWGGHKTGMSAEDIINPDKKSEKPEKTKSIHEAVELLKTLFGDADGDELEAAKIIKAAEKHGISQSTLVRARETCKVTVRREKKKGAASLWVAPKVWPVTRANGHSHDEDEE